MDAFGIVVIAVLAVSVIAGLVIARKPPNWDELGGESPVAPPGPETIVPTRVDDEADLRALVAEKRARRLAGGGKSVASDDARTAAAAQAPATGASPWSHLETEVVDEARALVARRRARLERTGKHVPDELAELERLLGPPHA